MNNLDRIYCGSKHDVPDEYDRMGTRNECLKCGFGAGMLKYKWKNPSLSPRPPPRNRRGCYRPKLSTCSTT